MYNCYNDKQPLRGEILTV